MLRPHEIEAGKFTRSAHAARPATRAAVGPVPGGKTNPRQPNLCVATPRAGLPLGLRVPPVRLKLPAAAWRADAAKPGKALPAVLAAKQGGVAKPGKLPPVKPAALPAGAPRRRRLGTSVARVRAPAPRALAFSPTPHVAVDRQVAGTEATAAAEAPGDGPPPDAAGATAGGGRADRPATAAQQARMNARPRGARLASARATDFASPGAPAGASGHPLVPPWPRPEQP